MFETALAAARRTGNSIGIALQQANLGINLQEQGDVRGAEALLEQALATFQAAGDGVRQEKVLYALAMIRYARGDFAVAQQRLVQTQKLAQATGNRTDMILALNSLGLLKARRGTLQDALRLQDQALASARELHDQSRTGSRVLEYSAETLAQLGELARARQRYREALGTRQKMGDRLSLARIHGGLSRLAYQQGDLAQARALAETELRFARETGARATGAQARIDLARVYIATGELAVARRYLDEALATSSSLGLELDAAKTRFELAQLALAQGKPQAAADLARETAVWYSRRQLVPDMARSLALLSEALLATDQLAEAQEVSGRLRPIAARTENLELRILLAVQLARVGAAAGEVGESSMQMRQAVDLAARTGLVATGFEARLLLGIFQADRLDRVAGRRTLENLRRDAEAKGFRRLARQAAAALRAAQRSPISRG
jgi:ATP/maltotriose-dependent transcriptional regulator MalT